MELRVDETHTTNMIWKTSEDSLSAVTDSLIESDRHNSRGPHKSQSLNA